MYYFIPAWYGQTDEFWKTAIDPWYRIRQKIEFDDSLHQVRIFQDEDLALNFCFWPTNRICVISCIVMMSWKLAIQLFLT